MERKTQTGYLMLADISGYTSFVAQTEIVHADLALSYLLETIIERLSGMFTIAKLEGDAVHAHFTVHRSANDRIGQKSLLCCANAHLGFCTTDLNSNEQ